MTTVQGGSGYIQPQMNSHQSDWISGVRGPWPLNPRDVWSLRHPLRVNWAICCNIEPCYLPQGLLLPSLPMIALRST